MRCLTAADRPLVVTHKADLAAGAGPGGLFDRTLPPATLVAQRLRPAAPLRTGSYGPPAGEAGAEGRSTACGPRFGIRDLKMLPNPEAADNREYIDCATDAPVTHRLPQPPPERKYLIQINGRRIFARGGNWIPCDLLYGRPRKPFYEHLIRSAAEANYNLFRVWGGGLIDKPEFFELCDRYGIMLFQEFPNAGVRLPETDEALAIAAREIRADPAAVDESPRVVRYGGGNEWYRDAQNSRQMAQLREICNQIDPTRPYHDPDPETIAQRHGPTPMRIPATIRCSIPGSRMTGGPDNPMEWTEYGAVRGGERRDAQGDHAGRGPVAHPLATIPIGFGTRRSMPLARTTGWARAQYRLLFGELPDLETTVQCSQFVQAEALRYANQSMRRFRWHRSAMHHVDLQRALAQCRPRLHRRVFRPHQDGLLLHQAGLCPGGYAGRLLQPGL